MIAVTAAADQSIVASPSLASGLQQHHFSLAISISKTNRPLLLGLSIDGQIKLHEHLFDRSKGLVATGDSLWVAARKQLWKLDNHLAPYTTLTFPILKAGSNALARFKGEWLRVSAMANGDMVGLALAERQACGAAAMRSLCVDPAWRRQGSGTGRIARPMLVVDQDAIGALTFPYQANEISQPGIEMILRNPGLRAPKADVLPLKGQGGQLPAVPGANEHPLVGHYRLLPWGELNDQQLQQIHQLGSPDALLPPADPRWIEPKGSLALFHQGDGASEILAERLSVNSRRCSSPFVAAHPWGRTRWNALLATTIQRQQQTKIPMTRSAVATNNHALQRLLKRHLKTNVTSINLSRTASCRPRGAAA